MGLALSGWTMAPQRARVLITALCVLALFQPVVANDNDPGMPFSVLALIILSFGVICGAFRWPAFHFKTTLTHNFFPHLLPSMQRNGLAAWPSSTKPTMTKIESCWAYCLMCLCLLCTTVRTCLRYVVSFQSDKLCEECESKNAFVFTL